LALYFREFEPLIGKCKFGTNCKHESEPGCKILEAVEAGVISEERFESWQRIREEIRTGSWDD
ncbi:MAG: ribosome small subunit-dependent GTPase A, partial [Treponema sp.]|nr:ribosome small subunit-dependent GTPase A [Treponema sp.]